MMLMWLIDTSCYLLLVGQENGIAGYRLLMLLTDAYGADHIWCMIVADDYHGVVQIVGLYIKFMYIN